MAGALALFFLAGCAGNDEDDDKYIERAMHRIYEKAQTFLAKGAYGSAAREFDEVERQHPYSTWATKAQIMSAYSHYRANNYAEAISGLKRFIQLHPSHPDIPYAYYLRGLSYYEQISDITRDQKMTELALKTFKELIARFPDTKYAKDARLKIELTEDHLAGKDMEIGRYYLNQRHYLAAVNRFKAVVDKYQTTTHVPEALLRLVEAYLALGIVDEARKTGAVLGHNYPGSEWYIDAYELIENRKIRPQSEPWYRVW